MGEGWNPSTGFAWGCTKNPSGWVPYPKEIPRRHPLIDTVGRIDDPCARPAHLPPCYNPEPKFKPPREGYPNNICNLADYEDQREAARNEGNALATINLADGSSAGLSFRVKPMMTTETVMAEPPTIEDCCKDSRDLSVLKREVDTVLGPHEKLEDGMKRWATCMSPCGPNLPAYPCRGIIKPPRPDWLKQDPASKCKPSIVSTTQPTAEEAKPLTGREFVEGKRTCDIYPIDKNLPHRFNNPEWFKGYGCEVQAHPFYQTTQMDYFRFPPTAHTMTQAFYPISCKFTDHLAKTGMPRNRSLNLASNKTKV